MKYEEPTMDINTWEVKNIITTSDPGLEEDWGGGDNINPYKYN